MNVDYLIVGLGIAGISFSKILLNENKSFVVISELKDGATANSGGIFNPVVLRRFTAPTDTPKYVDTALEMFDDLEDLLQVNFIQKQHQVHRIFASVEEENNWFTASDKRHLKDYIDPKLIINDNPHLQVPKHLGRVLNSFKLLPILLLKSYAEYLAENNLLLKEKFLAEDLVWDDEEKLWNYKHIKAKNIVLAEGVGVSDNPLVPKNLLRPNKGEYIIIKAPDLKTDKILKAAVYITPMEDDLYKVGASYGPDDASTHTTTEARDEILAGLNKMITCDYEIISQEVGVRPVTNDREPFLGELKQQLYIFNGLGTRGFTRGPLYAKMLYDFIEHQVEIPRSMNISRIIS